MAKKSPLKHYFDLRQRLIDNKNFLLQIATAKSDKSRCKLIKAAKSDNLNVLRDLLRNIANRSIEIEKSIYYQLQNKNKVQDLVKILKRFQKYPGIYSSERNLRQFLINSISLLPYIIKTILKNG